MKLRGCVLHMHISVYQDQQDLGILALFFGKIPQGVGKSLKRKYCLFKYLEGNKENKSLEERIMHACPSYSPVRELTCCFNILCG